MAPARATDAHLRAYHDRDYVEVGLCIGHHSEDTPVYWKNIDASEARRRSVEPNPSPPGWPAGVLLTFNLEISVVLFVSVFFAFLTFFVFFSSSFYRIESFSVSYLLLFCIRILPCLILSCRIVSFLIL